VLIDAQLEVPREADRLNVGSTSSDRATPGLWKAGDAGSDLWIHVAAALHLD
jgi:hypothetical protein